MIQPAGRQRLPRRGAGRASERLRSNARSRSWSAALRSRRTPTALRLRCCAARRCANSGAMPRRWPPRAGARPGARRRSNRPRVPGSRSPRCCNAQTDAAGLLDAAQPGPKGLGDARGDRASTTWYNLRFTRRRCARAHRVAAGAREAGDVPKRRCPASATALRRGANALGARRFHALPRGLRPCWRAELRGDEPGHGWLVPPLVGDQASWRDSPPPATRLGRCRTATRSQCAKSR